MELVMTCAKVLWILWASASLGCSFILKDCNEGRSIKLEASPGEFRIRCRGVTRTDNITWSMAPEGEGSQPFVNCNRCYETYCPECVVDYPGYRVTRTMTVSTLTVPRNETGIYGKTIRCGVGKHDWASCQVEGRGILEKFSVRLQGWRITGKADVRDAFDCSNETHCIWTIVHGQQTTSMKTFIENSGDRLECRLNKSIQEIYTTNGMYDVSVELVPGYGPSNVRSVMISPPAPLQLEASKCPKFVAEGDDLRCRCHHQSGKRGSPPAKVEWLDRQTEQDVLQIANVRRDMDGKVFTCRSSWLLSDTDIHHQTYELKLASTNSGSPGSSSNTGSSGMSGSSGSSISGSSGSSVSSGSSGSSVSSGSSGSSVSSGSSRSPVSSGSAGTTAPPGSSGPPGSGSPGSPGSPSGSGSAYVIGAVIAALVAAGIVLVVIIVVFKRKKRQATLPQPGADRRNEDRRAAQSRRRDDNQFEMIVNDVYESSDGCLAGGANTARPASRDRRDGDFVEIVNDIYESSDGPTAAAAAVASPSASRPPQETASAPGGGGDVYAVVDKKRPASKGGNNRATDPPPEAAGTSDVYAQVVKRK